MAIRDKMRKNAASVLTPGETVQAVFGAQTVNQFAFIPLVLFGLIPAVVVLAVTKPFRVVVVTDRRILVCQAGRLKATAVHEVLEEGPRTTAIGEPKGLWWTCTSLGAKKMYVHNRFHKDIREADALRPAA